MGLPPEEIRRRGYWWSGDHRPEGILIVKGPGIRRGASLDGASVYDFLPTVMLLTGLPIPVGLDGRTLDQMCEDAFLRANAVGIEGPASSARPASTNLTPSEEELVEQKLRDLGYL
jgi:hypothetical protein